MKNIRKFLKIFFITLLISSSSNILFGMNQNLFVNSTNEEKEKLEPEISELTENKDSEILNLSERLSSTTPFDEIFKQKRPQTATPTAHENKRLNNSRTPVQIFAGRLPQFSPSLINAKQKFALKTISKVGTPIIQEDSQKSKEFSVL